MMAFEKLERFPILEYVFHNPLKGQFYFVADIPSVNGGSFRLDVVFSYSVKDGSLWYDYDINFLEGYLRNKSDRQFEDVISEGDSLSDLVWSVVSDITESLEVI